MFKRSLWLLILISSFLLLVRCGKTQTVTPSIVPTDSVIVEDTVIPTGTVSPTETPPPTATPSPTPLPTDTPLPTNTPTPLPTNTPPPTPTPASRTGLTIVEDNLVSDVAPHVVNTVPDRNNSLALNGVLEIVFDRPMDQKTTSSAFAIVDQTQQSVDGEVIWVSNRVLQFKPNQLLKPNRQYLAKISSQATSQNGEPLTDGFTLSFSTVNDLVISAVSPPNNAKDVPSDAALTFFFNRPVVPLTALEEQDQLPNPLTISPPIEGTGKWISSSSFLFKPTTNWLGRSVYTATISADLINQASVSGATLAADFTTNFSIIAPTLQMLTLSDGSWVSTIDEGDYIAELPLTTGFRLQFNQPMNHELTEKAISMVSADAPPVTFVFDWDKTSASLLFTPTVPLTLGANYTITVTTEATSADGGQFAKPVIWKTRATPPPSIISTNPSDGERPEIFSDSFDIYFASRMDRKSLQGKVSFDPPLKNNDATYADSYSLHFTGFKPETDYLVTIAPGMRDIYSNTLVTTQTISFRTGRAEPSVSLRLLYYDYGTLPLALFRPSGSDYLWLNYRNISRVDISLYRLTVGQWISFTDEASLYSADLPQNQLVHRQQTKLTLPPNEISKGQFKLHDGQENPLKPGLYFVGVNAPEANPESDQRYDTAVPVLIANANVTIKTTRSEALIWVTDLDSGLPLPNIPVTFYDSALNELFQATTDAQGMIYRDGLELSVDWLNQHYAVASNETTFGMAISQWDEGVRPYELGIDADYWLEQNKPTAYLYTDRPLYRPGQTVHLKTIVRLNDDLRYSLPSFKEVNLRINSYEGTVYDETLELNSEGTVSADFTLAPEATLGDYWMEVSADDLSIGYGSFGVAEYRKPTYQVKVEPSTKVIVQGGSLKATISADYYSGGAVANSKVLWTASANNFDFAPEGDFGRYYYQHYTRYSYYDGSNPPSNFYTSGEGTTDAQGRLVIDLPTEFAKGKNNQQLVIEATVNDVGGNSVSGRSNVVIFNSSVQVGIRTDDYLAIVDQPTTVELATVSIEGKAVPNQAVQVVINREEWMSVRELDQFGNEIWNSELKLTPVFTIPAITSDANGKAIAEFTLTEGGSYLVLAKTVDSEGRSAEASLSIWAAGNDYIPWRQASNNTFELIPNADEYKPGDTAEILLASPFQGSVTALVTVERGHILQREVVTFDTNSYVYQLPITGAMAPNTFVSVVLIKGVDENNPSPTFKMGFAQLEVDRIQQQLNVELSPSRATLGPSETVSYTVRVTDYAGKPVQAEVSLALADLAALSLANRRDQQMIDFFYAPRFLSVKTALLLTRLMDNFNRSLEDEEKGGGGGGGGGGVQLIRERFPDTAYWNGHVTTDANGEAVVEIELPDNLTTWRMDARAVTRDTLVGEATSDVQTTRPLLIEPYTPRFFVVGDRSQMGGTVHNNTDESLSADLSISVSGVTLNSPVTQTITIPPRQQAFVTWDVTIGEVDRVDAVFFAQSGELEDATRPTLGTLDGQGIPVYRYAVPSTAGSSGELLAEGATFETIVLPTLDGATSAEGQVKVQLEASLAAAMTDGLDYLTHYPYECSEQIVSKFLPNVMTMRAYQKIGLDDSALKAGLDQQIDIALQRLYKRQRSSGGFAYWDDDNSKEDALVSAYVIYGLLEAKTEGYDIRSDVIENGLRFLQNTPVDKPEWMPNTYYDNRIAFVQFVLARGGQADAAALTNLYEKRETLDLYAVGFLAQAIQLQDSGDPRLATLSDQLLASANSEQHGSRIFTHWEEKERDWWNWNSDQRTTAVIVETLLKLAPDRPEAENGVRWLMAQRDRGYWDGTQATAWSLMALTDWMIVSGELSADYVYQVAFNQQLIGEGSFTSANVKEKVTLTVDQNLQDVNRLAIGRTAGGGRLYYSSYLNLYLPVDQVKAVDNGVTISRQYYQKDDLDTPITSAKKGELLVARLNLTVPDDRYYLLVEDFLPAGLESVDSSLLTSQQQTDPNLPLGFTQKDTRWGWGWWYFNHIELRDEKVAISAEYLPAGTYEYTYLVRASTVGTYHVIPPTAYEFYFPDLYGRGDGSIFTVIP